jgi:hypothetical protein
MTDIHKQAEAYAARIIPADHTGLADPTSWEEQRTRFALCYLAGATAQQGGGMRWVKASDEKPEDNMDVSVRVYGKNGYGKLILDKGPAYFWTQTSDGIHVFQLSEFNRVEWLSEAPASHDEKLRVAVDYLQKIAQMSDPGSMVKAITDMKGLATEAMAKINAVKP